MRIELNSGGLSTCAVLSDYHSNIGSFIKCSKRMVSTFQAVTNLTYNMNGGAGNLQGAVNQIEKRITVEEIKTSALETIEKKSNDFMELARQIDDEVSISVNKSKKEFYRVNPWSKPPQTEEEKKWYQKAGEWLCEKGQQIVEGIKSIKDAAINWGRSVADTISKAWNSAVEWCKEHKDALIKIAISVVVVVALGVLAAATAGAGMVAIAGILDLAFKGAIIGGVVGATMSGATSGYKYYKENGTLKGAGGQIFDSAASGMLSGTVTGAATGAASGVGTTLMTVGNVSKGAAITSQILAGGVANGAGNAGVTALNYYFENGTLDGSAGEIVKSFAVNFAIGSITQGISIGGTAIKHSIATRIDSHIANHTATAFEKFIAHSNLTINGFNSALKSPWYSSQTAAQSALFKNLAKYSAIEQTVKTKITEKAINNLTQIVFGEGNSYSIPKPSSFIEDMLGNFLDFGKKQVFGM
ncbi:MAG: DUF3482 domain-containing protein [Ruminococcus flavefaciens]|nr:DUF3482 domain-containing protein [Ruminococcus flavefaciens]